MDFQANCSKIHIELDAMG